MASMENRYSLRPKEEFRFVDKDKERTSIRNVEEKQKQ